jgi:heme-degrading monooxygenase HmoA
VSYEIVWSYDVDAEDRDAFEGAYGPAGEWAELFSRGDGFLEVVLFADAVAPGRYLTIDRWSDQAAFEHFMVQEADAYAELDDALASVSRRGTRLGGFVRR